MFKQIEFNGFLGFFISEEEWATYICEFDSLKLKNKTLESQVETFKENLEKARGEQKYKLKKLSSIIDRKEKQISALKDVNSNKMKAD